MQKEATGWNYLIMALYAFAGFAMEGLLLYIEEQFIIKNTINAFSTVQLLTHWTITCIIWGVVFYALVSLAAVKYRYHLFAKAKPMKKIQWVIVSICFIFVIAFQYYDWDGFKFVKEYISRGTLQFIFQYIYYCFEVALFMLIIVFGQKAFEVWFKRSNIPYGGIVVALSWGLAHYFTKGDLITALFAATGGLIFGGIYLLVNRDIRKTYVLLFLMFVL